MTTPKKVLTLDNINPRVRDIKVSFLGSLGIRASETEREILQGVGRPFGEMTACHIGDLQATGQKPCTFLRQVVALCTYPALLDSSRFPDDAKRRARAAMKELANGSVGSYNEGYMLWTMPQKISRFIERRDGGVPCTPQNITMSCGTAMAIGCVLSLLVNKEEPLRTGILISVPQCPVYAGAIVMAGSVKVEYSLDEECRWALNVHSVRESLYAAREHCNPKVLCITNPGNPTGQVLSRECIEDVIRLAAEENLLLFADEVYQDNVFAPGCTFHSFKKVLFEMGPQFSERVQLVSVYSISKGVIGECGLRSGYLEFVNIEPAVVRRIDLMASFTPAPVMGALALDIITDPPQPGEPSYDAFIEVSVMCAVTSEQRRELPTFWGDGDKTTRGLIL
ncbi:alanine aminotransferase 2-like [Ascaphus truei]|uniref:alanine aminotransferase 2-like n=1 Tax=Ascaphus truei TaxID=8439 RepID=UPI003F596BD6